MHRKGLCRGLVAFASLALLAGAPMLCPAASVTPGDILVADPIDHGVIAVDPVTGSQTVFSQPGLYGPVDVAVSKTGKIFVADQYSGVRELDPRTGAVTTLSVGADFEPLRVTVAPSGDAVVLNNSPAIGNSQTIEEINATTGKRSTLGIITIPNDSPSIADIAMSPSGEVFFSQPNFSEIDALDPVSDTVRLVATGILGIAGLAFDSQGNLFATTRSGGLCCGTVLRIDPRTGAHSLVTSLTTNLLMASEFLATTRSGSIVVSDFSASAVIAVDPSTGAQTTVTSGDLLNLNAGIAVYAPEPGASILLTAGALAAALIWRYSAAL